MPEHYFQKMNNQNPYADLILELQSSHFYPASIKDAADKKFIGLSIDCVPILKESKTARVREIVGDRYRVDYIPNKNIIEVSLKKLS